MFLNAKIYGQLPFDVRNIVSFANERQLSWNFDEYWFHRAKEENWDANGNVWEPSNPPTTKISLPSPFVFGLGWGKEMRIVMTDDLDLVGSVETWTNNWSHLKVCLNMRDEIVEEVCARDVWTEALSWLKL